MVYYWYALLCERYELWNSFEATCIWELRLSGCVHCRFLVYSACLLTLWVFAAQLYACICVCVWVAVPALVIFIVALIRALLHYNWILKRTTNAGNVGWLAAWLPPCHVLLPSCSSFSLSAMSMPCGSCFPSPNSFLPLPLLASPAHSCCT